MKLRNLIILLFLQLIALNVEAQTSMAISNFLVKENLLKNEKLAIIAADENDKPLETVNGTFIFSLNGFKHELRFNDGIAVAPQKINKSAFVYIKHTNDTGTHGKLYYVLKKGEDLNPIKISWIMLVIIPLVLITLASMFKRFIIIAGVILLAMFLFNHNQGLSISRLLETIFDGLKSLF